MQTLEERDGDQKQPMDFQAAPADQAVSGIQREVIVTTVNGVTQGSRGGSC